MALCLWFGVSCDPAEFLHLSSGAWRTRGGLHTSATPEVALLCDGNQIQQTRGQRALTWESVHIPGCRTCLASSPSEFTELKVSGAEFIPVCETLYQLGLGLPKYPSAHSQSLPLWIALRFKCCDHIPQLSMNLTGLSLPTWLRMKFLMKS